MTNIAHHQEQLQVETVGPGLLEISREVERVVGKSRVQVGAAVVFLRHTSASLVIQENADPECSN